MSTLQVVKVKGTRSVSAQWGNQNNMGFVSFISARPLITGKKKERRKEDAGVMSYHPHSGAVVWTLLVQVSGIGSVAGVPHRLNSEILMHLAPISGHVGICDSDCLPLTFVYPGGRWMTV